MADEEQVKRLLAGVDEWNQWRKENLHIEIDLRRAVLRGSCLEEANLSKADLREANLFRANLKNADLRDANLSGANLEIASLNQSNLANAFLVSSNLGDADLSEANLRGARLLATGLGNLDLSETRGLDEVDHRGPSHVSTSTLKRSKGKIPEKFLRGCGLSDVDIEYSILADPNLRKEEILAITSKVYGLRANREIQLNYIFISYSHKDGAFVDEMAKHLKEKGIRFWRDIHDATAGRLEKVVARAMRLNPTVLLVLSKESLKSDWVEHETRLARGLEKELGHDVLCPVALDDGWKDCTWPERLREQIMEYNILDFSKWADEAEFGRMFGKMVEGLNLFYYKESASSQTLVNEQDRAYFDA
jgi:hypothetical protein